VLEPETAETLAVAAEAADTFHHILCQLLDESLDENGEEAPAVCTCLAPGLLRALAAQLGVEGKVQPVEEIWERVGAGLQRRCAA